MNKNQIEQTKSLLENPKKIAIIPHRNPDGDAMGSTLALYHFLKQQNHDVFVMAPNDFPSNLAFLPASEQVLIYENDKESNLKKLEEAELLFTLDFNALHRTGEMGQVLEKLSAPFIMIDHHEAPSDYATVTYSDTSFGSTCEMIYNFILFLDAKDKINLDVATCLYTGITTDSGSYRFPKTTPATHRIVAELLEKGVKNYEVHNLLFDNNSYNSLQLLGRALQNMKIIPELKTSYITLSQKELDEFNYVKGDTEGIVNYGLSLKGIIFTAIFIENKEENIIKISFRSQGDFDVNQFARNNFNGGGHINAAGGKSYENMTNTINKFIKIINTIPQLKN
ncbi:DHH family phosphoesterase [Flavobacterium orientale]|uniref:Exopolyphosphatase n=1 Tax=Flavobacterium orientale TaxID=1756020 RepID=A0A917DA66_9FLAO|nr:bifunctional oligoribonuclease/PAP phosphatase NrnA [Flavobacterium orientale]GGD16311.1 exopolyphosphatase [Flavobacterium orientale]